MSAAPMVVAAARALCKSASDACNVDFEDNWKIYSETYLADAQAAIEATGALGLLAALEEIVRNDPSEACGSGLLFELGRMAVAIKRAPLWLPSPSKEREAAV